MQFDGKMTSAETSSARTCQRAAGWCEAAGQGSQIPSASPSQG